MPKLMDNNMGEFKVLGSSFTFSGARPETLGASEYTLATITVDISGSVSGFDAELLRMIKEAVNACKKSPRAENLMVRVVLFNTQLSEVHGFRPVNDIDPDRDYQNLSPYGGTALYDATYDSVGALLSYAKILTDQDYTVNGISFIITDGEDNASSFRPTQIAKLIDDAKIGESVESVLSILVGIGNSAYLNNFKTEAKINEFIELGSADAKSLAKLAAFVSKSVSSQSQSLGSGNVSTIPTF